LEALSCRTPVICSDIAENLEVLAEGYPFVHRSRDAGSLRSTLDAWFANAGAGAWTEQLFERCAVEFSWTAIAREYERTYREMTATPVKSADATAPAGRGEI